MNNVQMRITCHLKAQRSCLTNKIIVRIRTLKINKPSHPNFQTDQFSAAHFYPC